MSNQSNNSIQNISQTNLSKNENTQQLSENSVEPTIKELFGTDSSSNNGEPTMKELFETESSSDNIEKQSQQSNNSVEKTMNEIFGSENNSENYNFENNDDDNDPFEEEIEIIPKQKKSKISTNKQTKNKKKDTIETKNYTPLEAINEYYALKNKYQTLNYEKYIKPIIKANLSKREKKREFAKLPKYPCINCKRNVGTIFTIENNSEETLHTYVAKCGDITNPCPLDIKIQYSNYFNLKEIINNEMNKINEIKLNIIKEKNNAMFFKNSEEVLDKFEELTNKLTDTTKYAGMVIEENILKNDNPQRKELLAKSLIEFGQGFLLPFKQMIKEYSDTNNEIILNNALNFYKNEMLIKIEEIQKLKYDINYIDYDDNDKTYHLIQNPNSLEKQETGFIQDNKVISFIKGLKTTTNAGPKTLKLKTTIDLSSSSSSKTRKNISLNEAQEQKQQEDVSTYNINEDGSIIWDGPKYQQLWDKLPNKLKEEFIKDNSWMEDFMTKCITAKNKPGYNGCKLSTPPNIILPPEETDGKYDFGIPIYNVAFSKLDPSTQKTYLSLYSIDPVTKQKKYTMLEDSIGKLVEKELNYGNGFF